MHSIHQRNPLVESFFNYAALAGLLLMGVLGAVAASILILSLLAVMAGSSYVIFEAIGRGWDVEGLFMGSVGVAISFVLICGVFSA